MKVETCRGCECDDATRCQSWPGCQVDAGEAAKMLEVSEVETEVYRQVSKSIAERLREILGV